LLDRLHVSAFDEKTTDLAGNNLVLWGWTFDQEPAIIKLE